ncbi:MAG: PKD domain-containing protein, partial [Mongoliibacter sp.]|uniref:PKD domain-containing protein n=1 Tax=Mongoliibacter sp. TaxID=2022438 RepID=UPI0012F01C70
FTFSINIPDGPPGTPVIVSRADGSGFEGTPCLYDNNLAEGALTQWTITKSDGSGFQFRSIFLQEAGVGASTSGTIQGFKNGNPTGPSKPIQFNSALAGLKDYAGDSDFYDVDEIQIKANDINFFLDHFTHGSPFSPVDTDPTEVTSISLTGSPSANAGSVVFAVNFNKTALNVSTDDFQLTTTGSATGTIASVSGSGMEYLVTVSGISGEGSLRLNLRSGTNITNENGNSGTPAFTSGQIHFVSPCFIETFEDEVVGSSSFSGNGLSFSLQGNWEVSQETPFAGIGGSQKHLTNTGDGPYIITSSELITMNRLALYLSSNPSGTNPTNDGTVTVKGFNNDMERFSITKSSGFPTDGSTNSGYFFIDFSTEGGEDNTNKRVDRIEVSIGGNFIYLNLDNFEWCEAQPNNPPTIANPIPDQTAIQDEVFNFQFEENTFDDEDITDILIYSAQLNGGGALPAWLSFNAATRTFSGTPSGSDIGEINIEVIADDQEGGAVADSFMLSIIPAIFFEDATFVFDGTEKTIEIVGDLPDGATVSYANNTLTNVGNQQATATITGDNFDDLILTAELSITPATITGISFEDGTFVFDGTEKSIEITGTLPAGTFVSYDSNTRTNVGNQQATAIISGDNFIDLILTAGLTITRANIEGISFEDGSFDFDGTEKSLAITGSLPLGTSVAYTNNSRTEVGAQDVTATISGDNYTTLVLTAELKILPVDCSTEAAFNLSPAEACSTPVTIFFENLSTDADTWLWDFGDGGTSTSQNPIRSFTTFGEFTVRLTASNSITGCTSITEKIFSNQPVSADFRANTTFGCGPRTVNFLDQSEGATSWNWDFGDGTTSTEQNPSHTYQSPGAYTVSLSINTGSTCADSNTRSNYIQVVGPEVEFTSNITRGCGPLEVSFTNQSITPSPPTSFSWDFGDGQTSTEINPTHTYASPGIFTVSLTIRDLDGCTRTLTKVDFIEVETLDFEFTDLNDVSCFDGSDGAVSVQTLEGTGPFTYLWSNEETSATVTGLKEGTYSVTVTDANGCQNTKEITISAPAQPIIETDPASQITATTAVLGGNLSSGLDCVQEAGVVYGLTPDPTLLDTKVTMSLAGNSFSNTITELAINTTYFVRSYSINLNGYISYGDNQSF